MSNQKKTESDQETAKPSPLDLLPQQPELLRLEAEPTNSSLLASHQAISSLVDLLGE